MKVLTYCAALTLLGIPAAALAQEYEEQVKGYLASAATDPEAQGYRLQGEMRTGALDEDESESIEITLGRGDYMILGVCDEDCDDVDLHAYLSGELVDSDVELDDFPILTLSATSTGTYAIEVSMPGCETEPCWYAVGVYRRGGGTSAVGSLDEIPHAGGTTEWDVAVKEILLARFDADGSGSLDTQAEAASVSCAAIQSLDRAVRAGQYQTGLAVTYGFQADMSWVGDAVGYSEAVRAAAYDQMVACGITKSSAAQALEGIPHDGASSEWDDAVAVIMLQHYDADGSGTIDTPGEVQAVSCTALEVLDRGVRAEYSSGLLSIYGFREDMDWVGGAIGFSEAVRSTAHDRMIACGLARD